MKDFAGTRNSEAELRKIVAETIAFEIPLKSDRKHFGFRTFFTEADFGF